MKVFKYIVIASVAFLVGCNQKEMKISRAGVTIQSEMTDFSPAYIEKNEKGEALLNDNNLIGNTHWVISAERDLKLQQIAPFLQKLTDKKFNKDGMHPDDKDIYFIYSDTVNKQNGYVKMPFKMFRLEEVAPPLKDKEGDFDIEITSLANFQEKKSLFFKQNEKEDKQHIVLSNDISVEEFVGILIEIENEKLNTNIDEYISIL